MISLRIKFAYNEQEFIYGNEEASGAEADYQKVKTALDAYRRFKNDSPETVEIDGGAHGKATLKLDHVVAVCLTNFDSAESVFVECAAHHGRMLGISEKAKAAEAANERQRQS